MTWFWYVGRPDELLLDVEDRSGNGGPVLKWTRARLEAAIRARKLNVRDVWLYRSFNDRHYHIILQLQDAMPAVTRFTWEMQLGSDLTRGRMNIARECFNIGAAGLLIAPRQWSNFYREPDATCTCASKHEPDVMRACPTERKLRGLRADLDYLFGELHGHVVPAWKVKQGRVDLWAFARTEKEDGPS